MKERLNTALTVLKKKGTIKVGEFSFSVQEKGELLINTWSLQKNYSNLIKKNLSNELNELEMLFFKMITLSNEFTEFVKNNRLIFILNYDSYGKGSIELCRKCDGRIYWSPLLRD